MDGTTHHRRWMRRRRADVWPACRRVPRPAFTLAEMLLVVAILAVVAGAAVVLSSGAVEQTDQQMIQAECAAIRTAALAFRADMGDAPQRIAELLQSPDPTDRRGGWWWRAEDDKPPQALYSYDPATRRGWNGPYLRADHVSAADDETVEARLTGSATHEESVAAPSSGRRLAILLSRYTTFPQKTDGDRLVSHYQFDTAEAHELAVRFVRDPLVSPGGEQVISRVGLGVEP